MKLSKVFPPTVCYMVGVGEQAGNLEEMLERVAGTYDEAWQNTRAPRLPTDFDPRFHNAAPPELIAAGGLRGDEDVVVVGATAAPRWEFRLPGLTPPDCDLALRTRREHVGRRYRCSSRRVSTSTIRSSAPAEGWCPKLCSTSSLA